MCFEEGVRAFGWSRADLRVPLPVPGTGRASVQPDSAAPVTGCRLTVVGGRPRVVAGVCAGVGFSGREGFSGCCRPVLRRVHVRGVTGRLRGDCRGPECRCAVRWSASALFLRVGAFVGTPVNVVGIRLVPARAGPAVILCCHRSASGVSRVVVAVRRHRGPAPDRPAWSNWVVSGRGWLGVGGVAVVLVGLCVSVTGVFSVLRCGRPARVPSAAGLPAGTGVLRRGRRGW